ncbi:hypothetical protein [Streptomyces sp. NPDC018693]|uniref:hypothetical protein n=1 Tax=unclassified Streptomyces TaxID=2593676 RepID=UPI0037881A12
MAWEEWEQLKAQALARSQNGMQLNGVAEAGGAGATGAPDFRTNKPGKKIAVNALRVELPEGTKEAGSHPDESSSAAAREFSGWETGSGLTSAHEEWGLQVQGLLGRLDRDLGALEGSHGHFQYVDHGVGSQLAQLDSGVDPRREA